MKKKACEECGMLDTWYKDPKKPCDYCRAQVDIKMCLLRIKELENANHVVLDAACLLATYAR